MTEDIKCPHCGHEDVMLHFRIGHEYAKADAYNYPEPDWIKIDCDCGEEFHVKRITVYEVKKELE